MKTMHAHSCRMVEGIEIKPGRKVGRGKCNIVLGGGPFPRKRGIRRRLPLLKTMNAYTSKTVRDTMLDSMETR